MSERAVQITHTQAMTSARASASSGGRSSSYGGSEQRKSSGGSQRVCRYCFQGYCEEENRKGSCPEAPDRSVAYVELLSCVTCARICAYHCFADDDGDYEHPCAPYTPAGQAPSPEHDPGSRHSRDSYGPLAADLGAVTTEAEQQPRRLSWRKWTLMSLLALCVPCLCLYFPLRACHRWALEHHFAGGRHEAVVSAPRATSPLREAPKEEAEPRSEDSGLAELEGGEPPRESQA